MKAFDFSTCPELDTSRLNLRALQPEDKEALFRLRSDPLVNQYLDRKPASTVEEVDRFIQKIIKGIEKGQWLYWAVCPKGRSELAGTVCLWNFSPDRPTAETGYELHPDYQGQGFIQEALEAVLPFAFGPLGLVAITALTHKDNRASIRLLLRNGFLPALQKEGDYPDHQRLYVKKRQNS